MLRFEISDYFLLLLIEDVGLTELFDFGPHAVRLLLLRVESSLSLAEMVVNQCDRARPDQRLQAVGVAAEPAEHAEAAAAGVSVLGEVAQQARRDARADQSGAGVCGVGEAGQQQQDGRLGRPRFRVVRVMVTRGTWDGRRGVQGDFGHGGS